MALIDWRDGEDCSTTLVLGSGMHELVLKNKDILKEYILQALADVPEAMLHPKLQLLKAFCTLPMISSHSIRCPTWIPISCAIIDNLVGNTFKRTRETTRANSTGASSSSATSLTCSTASTALSSSSEDSSNSLTSKLHKMCELDKQKVNDMYDSLDRDKLWKLKTGTCVEDKMKQLALTLDYEHPSHSMILDISDPCWAKVFDAKEWQEIRDYKTAEMPSMPEKVNLYLAELKELAGGALYEKVEADQFPLESDCKWIQKSYRDTIRLLGSDSFPKLSEVDLNNIRQRYQNLDRSKMWQLSTAGTVVEDMMKDVALTFEYEHPSHSLILDVNDHCWFNVFEPHELAEIPKYHAVEIPVVSSEVESYFEQLYNLGSRSVYTKDTLLPLIRIGSKNSNISTPFVCQHLIFSDRNHRLKAI